MNPKPTTVFRSMTYRVISSLILLGIALFSDSAALGETPDVDINFNRDIQPILSDNCFACHGPDEQSRQAGVRLDSFDAAQQLSDSGAQPIVVGRPDESEVIRRIMSTDPDEQMPPPTSQKRLNPTEKELLQRWVAAGAEYQSHWSFAPPKRLPPPKVKLQSRVRNPIDSFVLAKLESLNLALSPEADRATLLRRVSLDLTGVPPTPSELDAFLADDSPEAYEKVVDRLLASPRYGERMALEWLDAARYADTNGYNNDGGRTMWRWRDWVIDAFARNMPFDRFIISQLAGDLLPNATLDERIASGFNRNHVMNSEDGIIGEEYRVEYVADRVATTATVFLGLSMACARCHDHKFDPLTQRDYYRFFAFFNQVDEVGQIAFLGNPEPRIQAPTSAQQEQQARLEKEVRTLDERIQQQIAKLSASSEWETKLRERLETSDKNIFRYVVLINFNEFIRLAHDVRCHALLNLPHETRTQEQQQELQIAFLALFDSEYKELVRARDAAIEAMLELEPHIPSTLVMRDTAQPRDTFLLKRGQYDQPDSTQKVEPGVPECFPPLPAGAPANRLGLAQWLTMPDHPLTARVAVNRFWQMYFGVGLVETTEDFGCQGQWPSHLELLDWLSTEFIASGWDVKAMQRLIVTSATYRQSSCGTTEMRERDPQNRFLSRGPRFRLSAEAIRDNALAIAGLLHERVGGPSVNPYQPAGIWDDVSVAPEFGGSVFQQDHGDSLYRRSMYTFWKRTCPPPGLNAFDAPEREVCVVRRARTNTPLQALVLQNDPTYLEAARKLAERGMADGGATPESRLSYMFRLATARTPANEELRVLVDTFRRQLAHFQQHLVAANDIASIGEAPRNEQLDVAELAAYSVVASMILNLDETITKG